MVVGGEIFMKRRTLWFILGGIISKHGTKNRHAFETENDGLY